jgi:hypothetical protein
LGNRNLLLVGSPAEFRKPVRRILRPQCHKGPAHSPYRLFAIEDSNGN